MAAAAVRPRSDFTNLLTTLAKDETRAAPGVPPGAAPETAETRAEPAAFGSDRPFHRGNPAGVNHLAAGGTAARTFQPIRRQRRRSSMTCWPTAQWSLGAARIIPRSSTTTSATKCGDADQLGRAAVGHKATSPRRRCYCFDRTHPDGRYPRSRGARRWTAPHRPQCSWSNCAS